MSDGVIGRRRALQLGLLGAGSLTIGVVGLGVQGWPPFGTGQAVPGAAQPGRAGVGEPAGDLAGEPLIEPEVVASAGGVLDLDLTVAETVVILAGSPVRMLTYNGTVPGPTLHLRPGDRLRVALTNGLDQPTNLHTHGLSVSATGSSDNPFVRIDPGDTFEYTIDLPQDHPTGVFWYHPHHHGTVADQVFGGLYGAIVVDTEPWPAEAARLLVVSDVTVADGRVARASGAERMHGRAGRTVLVNGQVGPRTTAPAGSTQRFLVINACTSRYLDLDPGAGGLRVRGFDGGHFTEVLSQERVVLTPGSRADLELDVPAGGTVLRSRAYDRGASEMGMMGGVADEEEDATLVTVVATEGAVVPLPPPRAVLARDLRSVPVARSRTLELTMGMGPGGMQFLIDGKAFDGDRVDQEVRLGDVEEWTLRNGSPMAHPFHLHIWPMQLVRTGGVPVEVLDRRDVVDVPAGRQVVVRIAFDTFPGATVYHCHILDHEDLGMMGIVAVT